MFKGNSYKGYKTMTEAEAKWRNHLPGERRTIFSVTTAVLLTAVIAVIVYFIIV
jgi:hypothetical protein